MHRQLLNIVPMTYEQYENMMLEMPQEVDQDAEFNLNGRRVRVAVSGNFPVPAQQTPNQTFTPTPWKRTSCALCTSELDCRLPNEYCGADGCCHLGECDQDDDCVTQDVLNQYYKIDNFDSLGSDINPLNPQNDLTVTKTLCDVNPSCVGYNSYGVLKYAIRSPAQWTPQPPVDKLVPWSLYIKKTAVQGEEPQVVLPGGVKQFCGRTVPPPSQFSVPKGRCQQCLGCGSDDDCPDSTVCNLVHGCCVNNPCFEATAEEGRWVDGRYSRENECDCPGGEPYCCLAVPTNPHSAYCSTEPCETQDKVRACSYICEDPKKQFDAVMCRANERCCNSGDGAPVCCGADSDCAGGQANACLRTKVTLTECAGAPGFPSVYCRPSELCCNVSTTGPPECCSQLSLGCYTGGEANGCNFSDLIGY